MRRRVQVVRPDTLLRDAAYTMSVRHLSSLPVCEGRTVVGLLTTRDIALRATAQGCNPRLTRVREMMSAPTVFGRVDQSPHEAVALMERWSLHRLPVLDRRMHLLGIVSLADLCGDRNSSTKEGQRRLAKLPSPRGRTGKH